MDDLSRRLAELPSERRAALLRLVKERARAAGAEQPERASAPAGPPTLLLDAASPSEPSALKSSYKQFYDAVSSQLNSSVYGNFSFFLNYGYLPDGSPEFAAVEPPDPFINRNSVKLVLELIGDCPIDGKRVLDVGCGRGGTIFTLKHFFNPATVTGLDLSSTAIAFDRKAHGDERTSFYEGDAENLPFADGAFDVVTNVESSHSYPNINKFYREVARVLAPGGHFLYTDALGVQQIASSLSYLAYLGFEPERDRNITRNVLLSCDQVSTSRIQAFDGRNNQELMNNFLATPGSQVYEEMRSARWEYRIFKLRKRSAPDARDPSAS